MPLITPPAAGMYKTQFTDAKGLMTEAWQRFLALWFGQGTNGTIVIPKLTGPGLDGSITVENGLITSFTNPT